MCRLSSRPGRPAVRRRELPAVGSCNGCRPRIAGDDGREVQGFGKPHTLPSASIDRANDRAGTADEPTCGRRRRHASRQSHALVGTVLIDPGRSCVERPLHETAIDDAPANGRIRRSNLEHGGNAAKTSGLRRRSGVSPRGHARSWRVGDHDALLETLLSRRRRALSLVRLRRLTVLGLIALRLTGLHRGTLHLNALRLAGRLRVRSTSEVPSRVLRTVQRRGHWRCRWRWRRQARNGGGRGAGHC